VQSCGGGKTAADNPPLNWHARRCARGERRVSPPARLGAMRTFRPSFPTQMTQETGKRPNGAAAAILAVRPARSPRRDYEAGTAKIYHWRFARETYFGRCFSWNVKPKSGLIAVDRRSVDRKLRAAKDHPPHVFLTRRRRDSGRGERRRGVIDHGGHGERRSVATFRAHLPFRSCKLRVAAESRD